MNDMGTNDMGTNDMGKILNSHTVRFERLLPGPIERVWDYISTPSGIASWLCPNTTVELRSEGRINLKFDEHADPENGRIYDVRGIITECEPPLVLAYSWFETSSDLTSHVRFELESRGDQVLLVLTHSQLSPEFMPKVGAGWHAHLNQVAALLKGETPPEFWSDFNDHFKKYSMLIAASAIVASTVSPAIASSDDATYKVLNDQRQEYLSKYDRVWKDADRIKAEMDVLKRDTHADLDRALDDLGRELQHKNQDLKQIEYDIRDLDKLASALH
jgi:uncharacterized protein YndB with AHSA1/START domain